jgi:hypothetical protein
MAVIRSRPVNVLQVFEDALKRPCRPPKHNLRAVNVLSTLARAALGCPFMIVLILFSTRNGER